MVGQSVLLRHKEPSLPRPFRTWGYPWTRLLFGIVALAIANPLCVRPVMPPIALGIILIGLPIFCYWRRQATDFTEDRASESSLFASTPLETRLEGSPWR